MVKIIASLIAGAAVGASVGIIFTKRKYEKEIDRLLKECTDDCEALRTKNRELTAKINAESIDPSPAAPDEKKWAKISEEHKKELDELNKPANEEITSFNRDTLARPREEGVDYSGFYKETKSDIEKGVDKLVKTINNDHSEDEEPEGFDLYFYPDYDRNEDSYDYEEAYLCYYPIYNCLADTNEDDEKLIFANEVEEYTGMTLDQIEQMVKTAKRQYPDSLYEWYIVNHKHQKVYNLVLSNKEPPRP